VVRNILIVDDDHIWVHAIKKQFSVYGDAFVTLTAGNGVEAIRALKNNSISLVVTDLQMPEMDGFSLMAHLSATYPDIPVIIMTAYSTPLSKKTLVESGAAGYIEKPFVLEELADKIIAALRKQSEGGTLQSVPLEMFIQLIEMEQKTSTIRVTNKPDGRLGVLFFRNGELMDARVGDQQGVSAAYRIFGWDKVSFAIQDACPIKEKRISGDLQAILFDAMRLKDEAMADESDFSEETAPVPGAPAATDVEIEEIHPIDPPQEALPAALEGIRKAYRSAAPNAKGLEDVYPDDAWRPLCRLAARLGAPFEAGNLKLVYAGYGQSIDYLVLPKQEIFVLTVNGMCPKDPVMNVLSE
jgi:CheY-like chemotaxis protein